MIAYKFTSKELRPMEMLLHGYKSYSDQTSQEVLLNCREEWSKIYPDDFASLFGNFEKNIWFKLLRPQEGYSIYLVMSY